MKFSLTGEKVRRFAGEIADWHSLELSRWNQVYRNDLADALCQAGAQVRDGANEGSRSGRSGFASLHFKLVGLMSRADRNACKLALEIIASQVANNSANGGACGGMSWKLEPKLAEGETGEAA